MQLKPLYFTAALLASVTFQSVPANAQTAQPSAKVSDWEKRGVWGTVSGESGNEITADLPGYAKSTIIVTPQTKFRRYAPDSVTLAQATPSALAEIATGDQIRARGTKSADGLTVTAEEVVFGTFQTKAGTITAVDPQTREITVQEVGTNKPLVVKVPAQSQLKLLPNMHGPENGEAPSHDGPPHHVPTTQGGAVDMGKILDMMPAGTMGDLKVGGAVLVSGTKGTAADKMTAISLLANAGMIVQLMQQQADGNAAGMEQFLAGHGWNPAQGLSLPAILP